MAGQHDFLVHVGVRDANHLRDLAMDAFTSRPRWRASRRTSSSSTSRSRRCRCSSTPSRPGGRGGAGRSARPREGGRASLDRDSRQVLLQGGEGALELGREPLAEALEEGADLRHLGRPLGAVDAQQPPAARPRASARPSQSSADSVGTRPIGVSAAAPLPFTRSIIHSSTRRFSPKPGHTKRPSLVGAEPVHVEDRGRALERRGPSRSQCAK